MTDDTDRGAQPRADLAFTTVSRGLPLSDRVAASLQESMFAGHFQPGDQLPSERQLAEQFGVSRTVIREAVRSLAAKGLLKVRSGSGSRVANVDARIVADSMRLFLRAQESVDYQKIHDVRSALEINIAGLVAERATDADVAELRDILAAMVETADDPRLASQFDLEFHRNLARMTYNELYPIMLDSIGEVMMEIRLVTLSAPGRTAEAVGEHGSILDAITARDPQATRSAMRDHLAQSRRLWEAPGSDR